MAETFAQMWRIGRAVQEKAPPQRKGRIMARSGSGPNAILTVSLTGAHPQDFHPGQLSPL